MQLKPGDRETRMHCPKLKCEPMPCIPCQKGLSGKGGGPLCISPLPPEMSNEPNANVRLRCTMLCIPLDVLVRWVPPWELNFT